MSKAARFRALGHVYAGKAAFQISICLFLSLICCGCQTGSRPEGRYVGTLYQSLNGALQAQPAEFDIGYASDGTGSIQVSDPSGKALVTLDLRIDTDNGGNSVLEFGGQTLTADASSPSERHCYLGASARICYSEDSFSLEEFDGSVGEGQESLGIFGRLSPDSAMPVLETPRSYTLKQALQIALQRNFATRIEYEHAIQARLTAQSAYLQLLPHLGAGSVLMAVGGGVTGVLSGLGDFAPFLLPSRWFQADEAQRQSLAVQDALSLMRADLLPQVEGLAYASFQDEASLGIYKDMIAQATAVYHSVFVLEAKGQMAAGSSDHLLSSMQSLNLDEQGLVILVKEDHSAIAQALGLMNPDAVTEVSLSNEVNPVESAQPQSFDRLIGSVLERSLELRQIGDLIELAQLQDEELPFDWLDPAYDSSRDLGFQLGDELEICQSKVQELHLISQQMQQTLAMSLSDAIDDYNLALEQFPEAQAHLDLQKKRWARVLSQVFPGSSLNTLDIQSILNDYVSAALSVEATRLSFRSARARIDRLLLQNVYATPEFQSVRLP